ncbi:uncharacterized protein LOC142052298 isoform X1 [Phalacrocorax aristotelis]|uniref:uncharacterized protein LOC142052298 isoform X1 n=2 Tax=Phalacrocorax aristotelis TaxID=126867 RepID=UPI003F4CA250
MAGQMQGAVTFEDVAVYLSRAEWDTLAEQQQELYHRVMLDNYELLTSLGYPGPKPDIVYRMERGEAPWVCMPQSPARQDRPGSPSPGCNGDRSWLEEPPSLWWPSAGGCCVPEEGMQRPCPAGGQYRQWRLYSRRLLNKLTSVTGRSELLVAAAAGGVQPAESREQARVDFGPGKEGAEGDNQGVMENVTQSRGFSPHPALEEQNKNADPQEHLYGEGFQRSGQNGQCTLVEATFLPENRVVDLKETILKDHCYSTMSMTQLLPCAPQPCPLREHDYCRNSEVSASVFQDHEYCHVQIIPYQERVNKVTRLRKPQAMLHRLEKRGPQVGRIVRKSKQTVWFCKPCAKKQLACLRHSSDACCLSKPAISATVPPAKAEDNPAKGTSRAFCPAKQEAARCRPRSRGRSQGKMSEAPHRVVAAPPPSSAAVEMKKEATRPKVSIRRKAQRAQPIQTPDVKRNLKGQQLVNSNYESLRDAYKVVIRTVDHMLDSICQNLELSSFSQRGGFWPTIVQIDS